MSRRSLALSVRSRASAVPSSSTAVQDKTVIDLTNSQNDEDNTRNVSISPTLSPSPDSAARVRDARANNGKERDTVSGSTRFETPSPLKRKRNNDDSDDDRIAQSIARPNPGERRLLFERTPFGNSTPLINLVDESDKDEDSDNEGGVVDAARVRREQTHGKVPRIFQPFVTKIQSIRHGNLVIGIDDCVEFTDGTFMRIKTIESTANGAKILIGNIFVRQGTFGPHMPSRRDGIVWKIDLKSAEADTRLPAYHKGHRILNEVIQKIRTVVNAEEDDDYGLWRRPLSEVMRKRELRLTNQDYSMNNCVLKGQFTGTVMDMERNGVLYSRWQDIHVHAPDGRWTAQSLQRHSVVDTDKEWVTPDDVRQAGWQGEARYIDDETPITYVDSFCGAGGMSSGAFQAGLQVHIAFDKDRNKIRTHKLNFPGCKSLAIGVAEFIDLAIKRNWRCDVLHLSPPCQPFSSANTRPNLQRNEVNSTPLLACADVIKALRPRIVTVEEAPGIVSRHHAWFYALLHQFTELGFSIRWSELKTHEYGVPQLRRRFILIAAAPGEVLPPFPKPTHEKGAVTIETVLRDLKAIHRIEPLQHHVKSKGHFTRKPPYNPDCLAKTITCGASENYHPKGKRLFTVRELASLQTFAYGYKFTDEMTDEDGNNQRPVTLTELRQQIGNAVPPCLGKAVMLEVIKSLRESDRSRSQRLQHRPRLGSRGRHRELIVLD